MSVVDLQTLSAYSLTTGAALDETWLWVAVTSDRRLDENPEDDHSDLVFWDGTEWRLYDNPFSIRTQAALLVPEPGIVSINYLGGVAFENRASGGYLEEKVGHASQKRIYGRTVLNQVREILGVAYTVGTHRAIYRRQAPDVWQAIDDGVFDGDDDDCGFDAVHGFSHDELYAVGESGEIWQYDGKKWRQQATDTNVYLHAVVCAPDGAVYVAGAEGSILVGRAGRWRQVPDIPRRLEFWSVESFKGRIFLAANASLLFELINDQIRLVDFGECPIPTTVHHLFVAGDSLFALGSKHLRRFDGQVWHEMLTLAED